MVASAGAADGEAEEEGWANDGEEEGECSRPGISPRSNALRPQPAIRIRCDQNASTSTYAAASGQHPVVHVDSMIRRCDRPGDSSPVDPGQPAPQVRHCQPATGLILAGAVHRQETRIGAAAPSPSRPIRKPLSSDSTQPLRDHPTRLAASLARLVCPGFRAVSSLDRGWSLLRRRVRSDREGSATRACRSQRECPVEGPRNARRIDPLADGWRSKQPSSDR